MTRFRSDFARLLAALAIVLAPYTGSVVHAEELGPAKSIAGAWHGTFKVGDVSIRLVVHLSEKAPGVWAGTLDAPDAGREAIPIDDVTLKADSVTLTLRSVPATLEGKLNKDRTEAKGTWTQAGQAFDLNLRRLAMAADATPKRPQEPKKPYPYTEEEVGFQNKADAVRLAGTLTMPRGVGPFAAVVLVTGSGPQDRDETLFGHRPFWVLGDNLTRRGIAVLRVDDRGVGKSTGDFANATVEEFARDALAGLEYLKTRKEIDPTRMGLIGHSEGGTVASLVASRSADVAFVVMMAGPGLGGEDLWRSQTGLMLRAAGASEQQVRDYLKVQQQLIAVLKRETNDRDAERELRRLLDAQFAGLREDEKKATRDFGTLARTQAKTMTSPSFRFNLAYDPKPTLMKVRCPVLAINGEKDIVVACAENLKAIEAALTAGGNRRFTAKAIPNLNHFFQPCETGSFGECAKIEETFAPIALKAVGDWIVAEARRR